MPDSLTAILKRAEQHGILQRKVMKGGVTEYLPTEPGEPGTADKSQETPEGTSDGQVQAPQDGAAVAPSESHEAGLKQDFLLAYPDESKSWRFVAQEHFRGRSAHLDLRLESGDYLVGWTVANQQPDAIAEPVESLAQAKAAVAEASNWKMDMATGEILPREIRGGTVRKGDLRAFPKGVEIPESWLDVEGVTDDPDPGEDIPVGATRNFPGVFAIVDKGTVEHGAKKSWFQEVWIHGKKWGTQRWVFRMLERGKADVLPPGVVEETPRSEVYWVWLQPDDATPYVLSPGAIDEGWIPPRGISALPKAMREAVPAELRYWEVSGKEALDRRAKLAEMDARELAGTSVKWSPDQPRDESGRFGSGGGGTSGGASYTEKVQGVYVSGSTRANVTMQAANNPVMYHGTYEDSADSIEANGFQSSPKGTAGPGVYLSDVEGDVFYEKDPNRSAAVQQHEGRQPDTLLEVQVKGKVLDVGQMESKRGPSLYLRPNVYAASVLSNAEGTPVSIGDLTNNPSLAGQIIERSGYNGISWTFADGERRGTVVFDPANVTIKRRSAKKSQVQPWRPYWLQRRWFRGPVQVRFGASDEHYDLRVKLNGKHWHLVVDGNPLTNDVLPAYEETKYSGSVTTVDGKKISVLAIGEDPVELAPGQPANPEKDTPAFIQTVDEGEARVLDEQPDFKKLEFRGGKLDGAWYFRLEEAGSQIGEFGRSGGPETKADKTEPGEKGVRPLFGSPGGKRVLAKTIVGLIPPHTTYVEPFAGGAAVFFSKPPEMSEKEVLADADADITFAYRTVKGLTDAEIEKLNGMEWRIGKFDEVKDSKPEGKLGRLHRWLFMRKGSYGKLGGDTVDTGSSPDRILHARNLPELRDRLASVQVRHADYRDSLKEWDGKDTFFYLDPPYPDTNRGAEKADLRWTTEDCAAFAAALKGLKGKWLVSLQDNSANRDLFKAYHIRTVTVPTVFNTGGGKGNDRKELLIANYPLPKRVRRKSMDEIESLTFVYACQGCKGEVASDGPLEVALCHTCAAKADPGQLDAEGVPGDKPSQEVSELTQPDESGEKVGKRLRTEKLSKLQELKQSLEDAVKWLADLVGWASYADADTPTLLEFFKQSDCGFAVKEVSGQPWLFTWSANAFKDREGEIFSTKSLEGWAAEVSKRDDKGMFNFWHIPGSDFAKKSWVGVPGRILVEAGPFLPDAKGQAARKFFSQYPDRHPTISPEGWGCSVEYRYLPEERKAKVYDNVEITRTSVLPRFAAANTWTAVKEVTDMAVTDAQKKAAEELFGKSLADSILQDAEQKTKELEPNVAHKAAGEEAQAETPVAEVEVKAETEADKAKKPPADEEADAALDEEKPKREKKSLDQFVKAIRDVAASVKDDSAGRTAILEVADNLSEENMKDMAGALKKAGRAVKDTAQKERLAKLCESLAGDGEYPSPEESYPSPKSKMVEEVAAELAKQFKLDLTPIGEALTQTAEALKAMELRVAGLEKQDALKSKTELPRFVMSMVKQASQAAETVVPEGDALSKMKPKESPVNADGSMASAFFPTKK